MKYFNNHIFIVISKISDGEVLARGFPTWGAIMIDECPPDDRDLIFTISSVIPGPARYYLPENR